PPRRSSDLTYLRSRPRRRNKWTSSYCSQVCGEFIGFCRRRRRRNNQRTSRGSVSSTYRGGLSHVHTVSGWKSAKLVFRRSTACRRLGVALQCCRGWHPCSGEKHRD